ncbi:hypothetical protein D3C81_45650 [compost metagenome]
MNCARLPTQKKELTLTIFVRQKQYGITAEGKSKSLTLLTKDINTCTGLLGISKAGDVAFMAHLDTPFSAWSISLLVDDLAGLGHDIKDFQFFQVVGKRRTVTFFSGFMAISAAIASLSASCLAGSVMPYVAAFFAIFWGMSGVTRTVLLLRLWILKALPFQPIVYKRSGAWWGLWVTDVSLLTTKGSEPVTNASACRRDPRFKVPKGNGKWLTKAEGSA